jgi:hypothetical protein
VFIPAGHKVKSIDAFKSIVDITDDFHSHDGTVKYSVGGYYGVHGDFTRLSGKRLNTSVSTNGGPVVSITQLAFSDRSVVVHHSSSGYFYSVSTELVHLRILNTSTSPLGPIIAPP